MIANFTQFEAWFRCRQGSHKHPSANLLPFFPSFSFASLLQHSSITFTAGIENRFAQRAIIFGVMLHIWFDGHAWQIRKHATGVSHRNGQTVLDWIFDFKYWPFYESLIFRTLSSTSCVWLLTFLQSGRFLLFLATLCHQLFMSVTLKVASFKSSFTCQSGVPKIAKCDKQTNSLAIVEFSSTFHRTALLY